MFWELKKISRFQDLISLRGEVFFPNLTFEKKEVAFGCILNHTEVTRYLHITNNSPMPVRYRWSFLEDADKPAVVFHRESRRASPDIEVIDFEETAIPDAEEKDFGTEKGTEEATEAAEEEAEAVEDEETEAEAETEGMEEGEEEEVQFSPSLFNFSCAACYYREVNE